jgi:hypothetical protein
MKKIFWVLLVLVFILGVVIWRVFANLDGIVAGLIQDAGSRALKTEVTVSGIELKLTEGSATIGGLRVANPEGWSQAPIFDLERISVDIDINSIGKPVIVLDAIEIGRSSVSYEMKADGSNNMTDLLSGIERSSDVREPEESSAAQTLLAIKRLTFDGMDVSVTAEAPPEAGESAPRESSFALPELQMTNVGGTGAAPQKVATEIGKEMAGEIMQAAAREGVNKLIERQKEKLTERLLDKLKGN